jgi:hypothetical protein
MHKVIATFLLALIFIQSGFAQSQPGTALSKHAAKIKHQVTALGTGAPVAVKLKAGPELQGDIDTIGDSTFTIAEAPQNQIVTVTYEDVKKVSKHERGVIVGAARKTPSRTKSLIIGACVLGGLIAIIAIVVSNKNF